MDILINNKIAQLGLMDPPMLISGKDKSGASFYTITLAANLYKAKKKILLFSAYPMAVEEFMKQTGSGEEIEYLTIETKPQNKRVIIIKPGDQELFAWALEHIVDINQRIIIVKNFEIHSTAVQKIIFRDNIVLSGDIDKSPEAGVLREKAFVTKIFFSKPKQYPIEDWVKPEKYQGIIIGEKYSGITTLG